MGFRVGQLVQCIKKGKWLSEIHHPDAKSHTYPRYGDVLTIREVLFSPIDGECCLTFEEIRNPHIHADWYGRGASDEGVFCACRFRPLQETSMSILYGLLKTKSEKELVE